MVTLPRGTLTLLFSDIEGSTLLLARLGAAYAEALDGQRLLLRSAWTSHRGIELGTEGDSFFVVFETAAEAVGAAAEAQQAMARHPWPQGERLRVRMGIHTGSPTVHDGGYVGMDVHRAARIAGAAHGGQVVLSAATAGLVTGTMPDGTTVRDLGTHRLKDLAEPEHLYQLSSPGLPSEFPSLKSLGGASSLPLPSTPLIGREVQLSELAATVSSPPVRLLTLTGPGGTGKTRLAGAVAHDVAAAFPDGVFFVPLASITSEDDMWRSIGEALHVPAQDRTATALLPHVAHQRALLVLDNLEQLIGAGPVVEQLLTGAPMLTVLATSRRPLHVAAEHEYPVSPLDVPAAGAADAEASGAVQLFVQQARKVQPTFALTATNADDVVAICRRMDGLPLAIELTAARTKVLSPHALLGRLDAGLELAGDTRQVASRHRTLRDTISWSYDLLDHSESAVFRHLGVFDGAADLDAVRVVASANDAGAADVLDAVMDLVDASLVTVAEGADGEPRVEMLRTIRSFARDQLAADGELEQALERHAHHYLRVVEEVAQQADVARYWEGRTRYDAEDGNVRAAVRWALPEEDPQVEHRARVGLLLYAALAELSEVLDFPFSSNDLAPLERALERAEGQDSVARARCLLVVSYLLRARGDLDRGHAHAQSSLEMCQRLGEPIALSGALSNLATIEFTRGNAATARTLLTEATSIARECGATRRVLGGLVDLALYESVAYNHERALELHQQAILMAHELGDESLRLTAEHNLACELNALGRTTEALALMQSILPDVLQRRHPGSLIHVAEDNAAILADFGRLSDAARLLGAADAERERHGFPRDWQQEAFITDSVTRARAELPADEWDRAYRAGQNDDIADALKDVFKVIDQNG